MTSSAPAARASSAFLLSRYCAYNSGAGILRHLSQKQAHAASSGMNQAVVTLLNGVGRIVTGNARYNPAAWPPRLR